MAQGGGNARCVARRPDASLQGKRRSATTTDARWGLPSSWANLGIVISPAMLGSPRGPMTLAPKPDAHATMLENTWMALLTCLARSCAKLPLGGARREARCGSKIVRGQTRLQTCNSRDCEVRRGANGQAIASQLISAMWKHRTLGPRTTLVDAQKTMNILRSRAPRIERTLSCARMRP